MFKKIIGILSKEKQKELTKEVLGKEVDQNTFLIPREFRNSFEVEVIKEKAKEFNIVLQEKKDQIPDKAKGKNLALLGFLRPIEIINFPMWGKPVYITYKRRRWRGKDDGADYFNNYDFHPEGVKSTYEFADFLKGINREELNALFLDWESIRYISQKDLQLV